MKKIPTAIEEDLSASSANHTDSLLNESNEVSVNGNRVVSLNGSAAAAAAVAKPNGVDNGYANGNGHTNNGHSITDDEEEVKEMVAPPQKSS